MATTNNADNFTNPISVNTGGTGVASNANAYGVLTTGTTSTGPLQSISPGASLSLLSSNGSGALPSFNAITPALVLIQTQTAAASSTSLTFTTGITATYNTYLLVFSRISNATSVILQVSSNGGSSYIATGYRSSTLYRNFTNTSTFGGGLTTSIPISGATANGNGSCWIYNVSSGNNISFTQISIEVTGANANQVYLGSQIVATNMNAFKISSASFSGIFSLYGLLE